jgi:hypothetical protein
MQKHRIASIAALAVSVFLLGAVAAQAGAGVPYTFHGTEQATFEEEGLCSASATITIDARWWLHVNATEAGLTEEEIFAALESDDPEGILRSVTLTEVGTFTAVESTGQVIQGRFTSWFGGNINHDGHTMVFTGTFSARGVDEDGNRIVAHFSGHATFVDGEPVVEFERGKVQGCA